MKTIINHAILNWIKFKTIFQFTPHDISTNEGKSNERYRRIFLTGGSTAIVKIFSATVNLITVPLTVNYLGAERYGLWMAISSILALMSFADLGLGNGLLNAISKANAKNNQREAQISVSSTFFLLLGISIFLFLVFISLFPHIKWENVFNVKSELAIQESGSTMLVVVTVFLINMPLGVIQRIQEGYQEGYRFQLWLILGSLISLVGLLFCIYFKGGLPWLVLIFSGGQLVATIINGNYLFGRERKYLRPAINYFDLIAGKQLIKSGFVFLLLGLFALLANASDDIIIAQTLGASSVSGYEIVKKLFYFSMFTAFIIQPLWPAFGEAIESGDLKWARKTFNKVLKISIISSVIISLPLLLFGKQIITIWIGKEYTPDWSLLIGFYAYIILNNYIGVISTLLNSSSLVKKLLVPLALTAFSGVLLKIFLSMNFGVSGIIWATIISWTIFYCIPSYFISKSVFQRNLNA